MMAWSRLIHFESEGDTYYGEPEIKDSKDLLKSLESGILYVTAYPGTSVLELSTTSSGRRKVTKILGLLEPKDVPIVKCVGLNYIKHSKSNPCITSR